MCINHGQKLENILPFFNYISAQWFGLFRKLLCVFSMRMLYFGKHHTQITYWVRSDAKKRQPRIIILNIKYETENLHVLNTIFVSVENEFSAYVLKSCLCGAFVVSKVAFCSFCLTRSLAHSLSSPFFHQFYYYVFKRILRGWNSYDCVWFWLLLYLFVLNIAFSIPKCWAK